jgi:threonine/homoserine/homoserine lactone efflux protein
MPDLHQFLLFAAAALALNLTPGPDMTFVLAQAAHRGTRAGVAAALGGSVGALCHTTMAAFGLAALFQTFPIAFDIVRYAGAVYLIVIAIGMIRNPPHLSAAKAEDSTRQAFRQGLVTNVLNPKVAIFFISLLPQFVTANGAPAWSQFLVLGLWFCISGTTVSALVAFSGGKLAERLKRNPLIGRIMGWISASVMLGLAVRPAVSERK